MKQYLVVILVLPLLTFGTACGRKLDDGSRSAAHVAFVSAGVRGWLGVSIDDVTPRLARKKALSVEEGAYVTGVEDGSPADDAGIRKGDVIVAFHGKTITDGDDLIEAVRHTKPGTEVSITVMRGNERKTLTATIERRREPRVFSFRMPPLPRIERFGFSRSAVLYGLTVESLNKQLGEYFGAPNGRGVLVKSVKRESEADKAGFKAGDVIVAVGKYSIADVEDLMDAFDRFEDGEKAEVEILRNGATQKLTLTIRNDDRDISLFRFDGDGELIIDLCPPEESEHLRDEANRLKREMERLQDDFRDRVIELKETIRRHVDQIRAGLNV